MWSYASSPCQELKLSREEFLALGRVNGSREFNLTALAIRGSVSRTAA
jgi:hypothetical protein